MNAGSAELVHLGLAWLAYFLVHSALASLAVKQVVANRWPGWMPYYRLGFNLLALILLLPPAWMTLAYEGPLIVHWSGWQAWLANGVGGSALLALLLSGGSYDGSEFLGLRQLRERSAAVADQEHFKLSVYHRYVRHPWYFLSMLCLWTRDLDAASLLSVSLISIYFVLGSRLEERKLLRYHGTIYQAYMRRVPGLLPLPWRFLTRDAAVRLLADHVRVSDR